MKPASVNGATLRAQADEAGDVERI